MDVTLLVTVVYSLLIPLSSLQLVSSASRCSPDAWLTRNENVTDDNNPMQIKYCANFTFDGAEFKVAAGYLCKVVFPLVNNSELNIALNISQINIIMRPVQKDCSAKFQNDQFLGCLRNPIPPSIKITVCKDIKNVTYYLCNDPSYGIAKVNETAAISCSNNRSGTLRKRCYPNVTYGAEEDFCISAEVNNILQSTKNSTELAKNLPNLVGQLANISKGTQDTTPGNLVATLDILTAFSSVTNASLNQSVVKDFLATINTLVDVSSVSAWKTTQAQKKDNSSSKLLKSVEAFTRLLSPTEDTFNITKPNIQLKGVKVNPTSSKPFKVDFSELMIRNKSLSTSVTISQSELVKLPKNSLVISIAYPTMIDILDQTSDTSDPQLNGVVLTTTAENTSTSIEMNFMPLNATLDLPSAQCVFWNFSAGEWDGMGCRSETNGSNIVCKCNHLTSFSILMSHFIPEEIQDLHYITLITLGISMGSLVISVIIEAVVWKHVTKTKTSHARHIAMLNIVLSLLTADTWFIVSGYLKTNTVICIVTVLFSQFLYLALFFWMFTLALLLLYHLVFLFKDFSRSAMMVISFTLGYLCPLIISISTFTVAYSRNHYLQQDKCWLNMKKLYLYLTFVMPPFTIVTINIFITLVAICKMLRPTIGEKPSSHAKEKNALKQIVRSVAILSPLLGLTWVLGFAFVNKNPPVAFHYAFNILNGLQGFFILVFGIIMDSKVQEALTQKFSLSPASSEKSNLLSTSTSNSN